MIIRYLIAALALLAPPAAAPAFADPAPPPAQISPAGAPTFDDRFDRWDAGPDRDAKAKPLHRWRTVDKWDTPTQVNCCMFGHSTRVSDAAFTHTRYYVAITATKGRDGRWWSGYASTKFSFSQLRGYFEFDANVPICTKGAWPALWMLPTTGAWPLGGEIDVLEAVGDGKVYQSLHSKPAERKISTTHSVKAACQRGWHRYGVLWRRDTISFYVDRRLTKTMATPTDMTKPMYLIFNLAMGGSWAGEPTVKREQMFVRRVTAWAEQ